MAINSKDIVPSDNTMQRAALGVLLARHPEKAAAVLAQMGIGPKEFIKIAENGLGVKPGSLNDIRPASPKVERMPDETITPVQQQVPQGGMISPLDARPGSLADIQPAATPVQRMPDEIVRPVQAAPAVQPVVPPAAPVATQPGSLKDIQPQVPSASGVVTPPAVPPTAVTPPSGTWGVGNADSPLRLPQAPGIDIPASVLEDWYYGGKPPPTQGNINIENQYPPAAEMANANSPPAQPGTLDWLIGRRPQSDVTPATATSTPDETAVPATPVATDTEDYISRVIAGEEVTPPAYDPLSSISTPPAAPTYDPLSSISVPTTSASSTSPSSMDALNQILAGVKAPDAPVAPQYATPSPPQPSAIGASKVEELLAMIFGSNKKPAGPKTLSSAIGGR